MYAKIRNSQEMALRTVNKLHKRDLVKELKPEGDQQQLHEMPQLATKNKVTVVNAFSQLKTLLSFKIKIFSTQVKDFKLFKEQIYWAFWVLKYVPSFYSLGRGFGPELRVKTRKTNILTLFHLIARQLAHKKHLVSDWSMEDLDASDWLKFHIF